MFSGRWEDSLERVSVFNNLIQYFGLSDEISPTEIVASEKFNLHSPGVSLEEDGKVAVNAAGTGFRYVLGENVYEQKIMNLKLKLESLSVLLVLHEVYNVASGGSGTIGSEHMCVGFIFWDVEMNNDFEDITSNTDTSLIQATL